VTDVTPTGTLAQIYYVSLTMGTTELLFVAEDNSGNRSVYAAPLDGSAAAAQLTLPNVGGSAPIWTSTSMAVSGDGTTFAFTAGSSATSEDLIVYKSGVTTNNPLNVSALDDNLYAPGSSFMDSMNPRVALSENGTYVVYGTTSSASAANRSTAWIIKTDGTGQIELNTDFQNNVDQYGSYYWADDDNLLLWAGRSTTRVDLFHYVVSTTTLTNLTNTGNNTAAPWDGGELEVDGGWVSPNGSYIYYVAGGLPTAADMNIIGVSLSTYTKTDITSGLTIDSEDNDTISVEIVGQQGSDHVWFVASVANATPLVEDVWVFNQSTAGTAVNLTTHTAGTAIQVRNLAASPDGTYASYFTGTGGSEVLYAVLTAGTGTPAPLTATAGGYLEDAYLWTQDSTSIIYGEGTGAGTMDLMIVDVTAATPTPVSLYAAQSYLYVFASEK
jgi:hypothetical protein